MSRKPYIAQVFLFLSLTVTGSLLSAAEVGDDGLHKQDWFKLSFKDIAEDIAEAAADGKRLALLFEQKGCVYCTRMHEKLLTDPEISDFIKENFDVVQFNLFGDEEVTDLDGTTLTEKTAVAKWGIFFTPTILFMPEPGLGNGENVGASAVAQMPGAFDKWTFLNMFRWVSEKGYENEEHFQAYHARQLESSGQTLKLAE